MRPPTSTLAFALVVSAAAACGTTAKNPSIPRGDVALPQPTASASTATPVAPPSARPAGEKNVSFRPSTHDADLRAIGLDPKKLVPLASMTIDQKKKLMPLFVSSLGYASGSAAGSNGQGCAGCHTADFEAETTNKAIARQMFDRWSVGLESEGGGTVFCDSCHDGRAKVIDRGDSEALRAFMKTEYQDKLEKHDGEGASCATCHGKDLEIEIFAKVWHVPAAPRAIPSAAPAEPAPAAATEPTPKAPAAKKKKHAKPK